MHRRGEMKSFAQVKAAYKLNTCAFYRVSIVKGFTYFQRHYMAARKGLLAENTP